jgi:uncharacterized protein YecE (DUF72 family)
VSPASAWPHDLPRGLRLGTSSWSEKSWVGAFYPEGTQPADFLSYYATRFPAVEADVTYYRVPSTQMVRGWARKTPPDFRLAAKFPRSIVHCGDGPAPDATRLLTLEHTARETDAFLHAMGVLEGRLGPLVLQFPYLNREAFAGLEPFLERLDGFLGRLPREFRYAVEVRNKAWLVPALTDVLKAHRAALVLVDLLYMPHPDEVADRIPLVTTDFVYARLIGDRKKVDKLSNKRFDKLVLDQRPRLERWAQVLRDVSADVPETYAFANNHYAGHGPATVAELAALVRGEEPGPVPGPPSQSDLPF